MFNPALYRIVLFDQRGAGRSMPYAGEASTSLAVNTTWHLIGDIEMLRRQLGIDRWLVHGLSWGSTLGLAYAERHPERVSEMVLGPVTLTRRSDISWLTRGVSSLLPAEWEIFAAGVPREERDGDLAAAYSRLLESPDRVVRERAAQTWCDWEAAIVSRETGGVPHPRYAHAGFRLCFARIVTHYFRHRAWLDEGQLLRDAPCLAGIPGVLVHGRHDLAAPLQSARELSRAWPRSELVVVDAAGHAGPDLESQIVAATDRFAGEWP